MKSVAKALETASQQDILTLEREGHITLDLDGTPATVDAADVEIISEDIPGWLVTNDGNVTVALDITITDNLKREGIARELVNRIQNIRKGRGFDITDRIDITIAPNDAIKAALETYRDYIMKQVLAATLDVAELNTVADDEHLDIDGVEICVNVKAHK